MLYLVYFPPFASEQFCGDTGRFYSHWPHSMQSRVYETVRCPPVCPSVCHSISPQQQTRCCRFAAEGPAGRRYRWIAAAAACYGRMWAVPRRQHTYVAECWLVTYALQQLVAEKRICLSVLLYGLKVFPLTKNDFQLLNFVINTFLTWLFRTSDTDAAKKPAAAVSFRSTKYIIEKCTKLKYGCIKIYLFMV